MYIYIGTEKIMYYFISFFVNWFFPFWSAKYHSVKNRHLRLGYSTDSLFIFASYIIFYIKKDNVLSHVPFKLLTILSHNVTYNVCYWLFTDICGLDKVHRRRVGTEPSMEFSDTKNFWKQSETNVISVLNCQGPKVRYANKQKIMYSN